MRLVNLTTARLKRIFLLVSTVSICSASFAQENSPYSRYGMGDLVPNQNMANRALGGIAAGYSYDYSYPGAPVNNINLSNPAALGVLSSTIFDVGGEIDRRTLKSNISPNKYTATNTLISYIQLGFPIASQKMLRRGNSWGLSFGLRPVSRINYKIQTNERLTNIDSLTTIYEGSGGINQVNVSTGIKLKRLSLGVSSGYTFGNKDYSTNLTFINDSVFYYKSNTAAQTRFGGVFVNAGIQYDIPMKNANQHLQIGAYMKFQQNLKAKKDNVNQTIGYDGNGGIIGIDTINSSKDIAGTIKLPASYSAGFVYNNRHWLLGADLDLSQWADYRNYGQKDATQNTYTIRAGAQYFPAKDNTSASKYWSFVKYRAGVYYGSDYIKLNTSRPDYGVTLGAALPLTSFNRLRFGEFVTLNTGVEIGGRGNKNSQSIRENIMRFNFGISMNASWFVKPKYN
ncbi:MAG: hypothetical protein JWQ27_1481 [Ferruginibacter sp.]|nr:hypothetical protein [Ferruginibacter sp.]